MLYDFAVVGGGIIGLSTAMHLLQVCPGSSLMLLEKEPELALHQTGRNSGVIHAGVYYQPGSLKARFSKEGAEATIHFCQENDIAFDRCGKLIVAAESSEIPRLEALKERCKENGTAIEPLDSAELRRREPHIRGVAGFLVPATGIVDYKAVAHVMGRKVTDLGGNVRLSAPVVGMTEAADAVFIATPGDTVRARKVVVCGGVMADRLARMCGIQLDFRIVPFRGEYFRLPETKNGIVKHLIYPVPDPNLPFLGVHLTRMMGGFVTVGPNAVLGFAREQYGHLSFNLRDTIETLSFRGSWLLARKHARSGMTEFCNSLNRSGYLALCRRYCPELALDDLQPHPTGIRAQAVLADGTLVHDFLIRRTQRTVHVCNAPSPAATSAIPIGRYIAKELLAHSS